MILAWILSGTERLQVTGVFARRGYNVQSLAVGNSEVEGQSRITMVIPGSAEGTSKIIKQLNKLVHVQQVPCCSPRKFSFILCLPSLGL